MAHFRYIVHDVQNSIDFYVGLLSFKLIGQYGPAMAIVQRDDLELWLAGPMSSAASPMPDGSKPEPGGWNRVVLKVDDLDEFVASLKSKNVKFRNAIVTGPGGRQILLEDPSGNCVELFEAK